MTLQERDVLLGPQGFAVEALVLVLRDTSPPSPAWLSVSLQVAQNRSQHPQEERHLDPGL